MNLNAFAILANISFPDSIRALFEEGAAMWGLLAAAAIVLVLTPLLVRLAHRTGVLDRPNADRPRVHVQPIPRIGGVAIFVGILIPLVAFVHPRGPLVGVTIGIPLVAAVGLVDDVRGLRAATKLLAVTAIALIPVLAYDLSFKHVGLPVIGNLDLGAGGIVLTVLWIALVANLVNLIDGMDALAAGMVAIACAAFAILAASFGRMQVAALALIVLGACAGFLRHNYHPAKIFMGDTGALVLGYVLGCLAVEGVMKTAATIALAAPLLVMAVPILDTSFVVLKRLKYKRRPWMPDQNHFYHRFLRIGLSQRRTAAYLHVWAALLGGWALMLRFVPPRPHGHWDVSHSIAVAAAGLVVVAASVWMVYTLEILKSRHLRALRLRRTAEVPAPEEDGREAAVERALTARS
jgi:UDP-GlcNAc:undecaprenyl-phosphate GlcNAc-1-phosphate transferase